MICFGAWVECSGFKPCLPMTSDETATWAKINIHSLFCCWSAPLYSNLSTIQFVFPCCFSFVSQLDFSAHPLPRSVLPASFVPPSPSTSCPPSLFSFWIFLAVAPRSLLSCSISFGPSLLTIALSHGKLCNRKKSPVSFVCLRFLA